MSVVACVEKRHHVGMYNDNCKDHTQHDKHLHTMLLDFCELCVMNPAVKQSVSGTY